MAPNKRTLQNTSKSSKIKKAKTEPKKQDPVDQNLEILVQAIEDSEKYAFPASDLMAVMCQNVFPKLVEERNEHHHKVTAMIEQSMNEAWLDLQKRKADLEYDVNNVDEAKQKKEKHLEALTQQIEVHDKKIVDLQEAKGLDEANAKEGDHKYQQEVDSVNEKSAEFDEFEAHKKKVQECFENQFTPFLHDPPINANTTKKNMKIIDTIFKEYFPEEGTALTALPLSLFKEITERTEFEMMCLKHVDTLFNHKIAEFEKKMEEVKPDTSTREALEEAAKKLRELADGAQKALKDQQAVRRQVKESQKAIEKELNTYPQRVEEKKDELKTIDEWIAYFSDVVKPAHEFLLTRTEIVPPEPEVEQVVPDVAAADPITHVYGSEEKAETDKIMGYTGSEAEMVTTPNVAFSTYAGSFTPKSAVSAAADARTPMSMSAARSPMSAARTPASAVRSAMSDSYRPESSRHGHEDREAVSAARSRHYNSWVGENVENVSTMLRVPGTDESEMKHAEVQGAGTPRTPVPEIDADSAAAMAWAVHISCEVPLF